jgi:DNA-binding MarR family transcriptional regulator
VARPLSQIGLSIKKLQARHHRAIDAALRPKGLSLVQWDALRHLHENPDASLRDLVRLTFQSEQAAGTLANRLVAGGLVRRAEGPGRAVRHQLTQRGAQLLVAGSEIVEGVLAESFASLGPEELSCFDSLLGRLLA